MKKPTSANKKSTVTSFLLNVFNRNPAQHIRCYRGQSSAEWELKPSVLRGLRANAEQQIFSELMVEAPQEFRGDRSMFSKLVRAQHYGLPTRLVDVSLNPLVGLFFACNEAEHHDKDGVVQILDFDEDRVKFADSDAISLICNLARLRDVEKDQIVAAAAKKKRWPVNELDNFRAMPAMMRLTQFVRVEKPYFLDKAVPRDLFRYFFVYPEKSNSRVIAQSGAFIAAGLLQYRAPGLGSGFSRAEIISPGKAKKKILRELDLLNINQRTLFPEIESTASYIKERWKVEEKPEN